MSQRSGRDVDEVINYVRAMKHGLSLLADLPVSVRLIREIHAELLRGVRGSRLTPGELRRSQNCIGPEGSTLAFEGLLAFFLRGVTQVSIEAADTARRILELREPHRLAITEHRGRAAGNGHRVLERLYEQPISSVKGVQALPGTTYAGANPIVQRLEDLGILVEFTGQIPHRRFHYDAYIHHFDERAATPGQPS